MILFQSTTAMFGMPTQVGADEIHSGDLIDRLQALEQQNSDLQQLVCDLLQKNQLLRLAAWRSHGN